jgi:hypothetical protein
MLDHVCLHLQQIRSLTKKGISGNALAFMKCNASQTSLYFNYGSASVYLPDVSNWTKQYFF